MPGIIRPAASATIKHFLRFIKDRNYRQLQMLASKFIFKKRYDPGSAKIYNWKVYFPDYMSFIFQFEDIFVNQSYLLPDPPQKILDIGSNMGLSILYYSYMYPEASITGLEPDAGVFQYLEKNLRQNNIENVTLLNKAAWVKNETLNFVSDGADSGRLTEEGHGSKVEAIDINSLLSQENFDFIKIDIEGAENSVFPHIQKYLCKTKYIFIEYHSSPENSQKLGTILKILEDNNFSIKLKDVFVPAPPFVSTSLNHGYDYQTNIFAKREV